MTTKHCSMCAKAKPEKAFGRNRSTATGLQTYCRTCRKKRRKANCESKCDRYGLAPAEATAMMLIPLCQGCGYQFSNDHELKFDHCHDAGHVRGVLCHFCNMACAGKVNECLPRLRGCIAYLERDLARNEQN